MELDCGIPIKRIVAWLEDELGLSLQDGMWEYRGEGMCRIALEPLESRELGMVSIERACMRVEGDKSAMSDFMRLFTLRFMSAGG